MYPFEEEGGLLSWTSRVTRLHLKWYDLSFDAVSKPLPRNYLLSGREAESTSLYADAKVVIAIIAAVFADTI